MLVIRDPPRQVVVIGTQPLASISFASFIAADTNHHITNAMIITTTAIIIRAKKIRGQGMFLLIPVVPTL